MPDDLNLKVPYRSVFGRLARYAAIFGSDCVFFKLAASFGNFSNAFGSFSTTRETISMKKTSAKLN